MQFLSLLVGLLLATGTAQSGSGDKETCVDPVPTCDAGRDSVSCALDSYFQRVAHSPSQDISICLNKTSYSLSTTISFSNRGHFELVGCAGEECMNGVTIECCSSNAGLFLHNITTVTVRHVAFYNCTFDIEGKQKADKRNGIDDDHAALYVESVEKLVLDTITINGTLGVGLMLYFVSTAEVSNSTFTTNGLREISHNNSSGGVYVFAPWTNSSSQQSGQLTSSYHFTSCTFQDNYALGVPINSRKQTFHGDTYVSGHGGGLSFYLTDYTQHATVEVFNCTFENNEALLGAGLSIFLHGAASHNTIRVTNTTFRNNNGHTYNCNGIESGGGGAQVMLTTNFFNGTADITNNSVTFNDCIFVDNSAYWGGGLSVVSACEHVAKTDRATNRIRIEDCQWSGNRARLGSAIDCVSWAGIQDHVLPVVTLRGNKIHNNTVIYNKEDRISVAGTGTLYSDLITINLEGRNTFADNVGSGITAVDAILNFTAESDTEFTNNTGIRGGGLSLFGKATVMLCAGSKVHFDQNSAKLLGGAIYYRLSGPRNLITSQKCFIQYENRTLPPDQWNTTVNFTCNDALMDGHSVFASSLLPCIWTGGYHVNDFFVNEDNLTYNLKKVFKWSNTTFVFSSAECNRNSTAINTEISTDTLNATKEMKHIEASPGIPLDQEKYSQYVRNELGETSYSVFRGDSQDPSAGNIQAFSRYISRMRMRFVGEPYSKFNVTLTSPWTLSYIIDSEVSLIACPPGFRMASKEENKSKECECSVGTSKRYHGILYCNHTGLKRQAHLQKSYWAGYLRIDNEGKEYKLCNESEVKHSPHCYFATGRCIRGFCSKIHESVSATTPLPHIPSNQKISYAICRSQNRAGILCGKCRKHYGYNINNASECIPCNSSNTDIVRAGIAWITVRFLPLTIMVAVFLLFDIDILSGSMQSFILYSQMLRYLSPLLNKTLNIDAPGVREIQDASFTFYDIWRLKFTGSLIGRIMEGIPKVCAKNLPILGLYSLEYLPAMYPLGLIFGLWFLKGLHERFPGRSCTPCCRLLRKPYIMLLRLRRKWSPNSTIIHGLSAFIVFSYTNFLVISVYLVTPSWLQIEGGLKNICRVACDGNMAYGGTQHLPYMIVALLILLTFVAIPPLILILVPLVPRAAVHLQPERSNRVIWLCDKMFSGPKWQFFLDAFQGGFKPRYSFFAGLFFLYRIAITITFSFTVTLEWQYFIHTAEVVLFLVIHSLCQPYRHRIYNIVDTLIYFNMLAVLLIGSFMWQQSHNGDEIPEIVYWLALIVMNIPQGGFVGYLMYKIIRGIHKLVIMQRKKRKLKESQRQERQERQERQSSADRDLELLNDSFQLRTDYAELTDDFADEMAL